jgi:hypothetical protein
MPNAVNREVGPTPSSVANAVRLMVVGAALGLAYLIVVVTTKSALRTAIAKNWARVITWVDRRVRPFSVDEHHRHRLFVWVFPVVQFGFLSW